MPAFALTSPDIFVGPYDLSNLVNNVSGQITLNDLDVTTFGSGGWHVRIAGLRDTALDLEGFRDEGAGVNQGALPALLGTTNNVVTIGMQDGSRASAALLFKALNVGLDYPAKVGDASTFKFPLKGSSVAAEGKILWPSTSVTATSSSGTFLNLGAVGANQFLYATQHITSYTGGGSIATIIQSATNSSGLGATTRLTFTTQTTASAEFPARIPGPITDTFWGTSWTITSTPTITNVVSMAIQ